jgi:hypothetical protein
MASFYDNLSPDDVKTLDRLSLLLIELRESREALLRRHAAADAAALLEQIRAGAVPEHPAYDDYVGIKTLEATRETIRADLREYMLQMKPQ